MTVHDSGSADVGRGRPAGTAVHTVADAEQARLLTDPASQRVFRLLLGREATATQLATTLDRDLNAVLYRLRKLLSSGLVVVARSIERAGRPVKVYRSRHDAYFVPYELTPFATLEERLAQQLRPYLEAQVRVQARRLRDRGISGQLFYRDASGEAWVESAAAPSDRVDWTDPARGPGIDFVTELELTGPEAEDLTRRLMEALERYGSEGTGRGITSKFSFSVALFPLDKTS